MKTFLTVFAFLTGSVAFAATEADLNNCTRDSNPQLCMSKVLLSEIQQRPGNGGGGGSTLGVIRFYHDDGRCNTNVIGQVFVTLDDQTNRRICQNANASGGEIWGIGVDVGGTVNCYDISDTSSASSACEQGMRRSGAPF